MRYYAICIFLIFVVFTSCNESHEDNGKNYSKFVFEAYSPSNPEIASGFQIRESDDVKLLEIFNPWDSTFKSQKFYLVNEKDKDLTFPDGKSIKVPIKKLVVLSASHLSFLDVLNKIDLLVGVSSVKYVVSKKFKGLVESRKIKEIGIGDHFKLEELINLSPDVVMISPQKGQSFIPLQNAGLTIIPNGDYLESDPLGRAEWIKFIGVLTGKEKEAIHIFDSIKNEYFQLKKLSETLSYRPTVITGKQYGGFWNLSGGKSYEAQFIEDAGADYLWKENYSTGGIMLDFETVYGRGLEADYWRFLVYTSQDYTYEMLKAEDGRYADFAAFKNKKVIVCNTLKKPFFQKGFLEPQVILADYIHIFHPSLLPHHQNIYYELLK